MARNLYSRQHPIFVFCAQELLLPTLRVEKNNHWLYNRGAA